MQWLQTLWEIGPFHITPYSFCTLLAVAAAWACVCAAGKTDPGPDRCFTAACWATLAGWIGARLVYCLTCWDYIMVDLDGWDFILHPWEGGYTLWGGVLGAMAAAVLYAKRTKVSCARLLDVLAPGGALALLILRAGEYFTGQGMGHYVQDERFQFFPLAVLNVFSDPEYDIFEYQIPVFFWEAVAALVILIWAASLLRRGKPGDSAQAFLILLGTSQIFLESLREDEFIRFGFVRFNQLMCAVVLLAVLLLRLRSASARRRAWSLVCFALCIGLIIAIEFALDKSSIPNPLLYAVMGADLIGLTALVFRARAPLSH